MSLTKHIPLTQGKFAIVDAAYYDFIMRWDWHYCNGYAIRRKYIGIIDGKQIQKTIHMHRLINRTVIGCLTDHKNGNGLDNRKDNLRSCTYSENNMNSKFRKNCTSKYKGVAWHKQTKKWRAYISKNKKTKYLGLFKNEEDAAKKYNEAAKELFGEFSRLNNISNYRHADTIQII